MSSIAHFVLHQPFFAGVGSLCLMIVVGLVLSDWAEKRRTRALLRLRDELKAAHQHSRQLEASSSGHIGTITHKPVFRIFRWEFVVLSVVVVVFIVPLAQKSIKVEAKSAPELATPVTVESGQAGSTGQSPLSFTEDVAISFRWPSSEPSLRGITFRLPSSEIVELHSLWPGYSSKSHDVAVAAELVAALDYSSDEADWDAVQNSVRPDYFANESGVALPSYDLRGKLPQ